LEVVDEEKKCAMKEYTKGIDVKMEQATEIGTIFRVLGKELL
jgi:hypothetical protein